MRTFSVNRKRVIIVIFMKHIKSIKQKFEILDGYELAEIHYFFSPLSRKALTPRILYRVHYDPFFNIF